MNFIQSKRATESQPINLDHITSIEKHLTGSNHIIIFQTVSGKEMRWRYFKNWENRDLDYDEIMQVILIQVNK